jgi:hypothetical protein
MNHFLNRAIETGDWNKTTISQEEILVLLNEKITSVSFTAVKEDVRKFIQDSKKLDIWSPAYFNDLIQLMKFVS